MRAIKWTTAISLALIIFLGLDCGAYSRRVSEEFAAAIESAAEKVQREDWEDALKEARRLQAEWDEKAGILSMWVNHMDVDAVSVGLRQFFVSIDQREAYHAHLYAAELKEALDLIYGRDAFALKNIF